VLLFLPCSVALNELFLLGLPPPILGAVFDENRLLPVDESLRSCEFLRALTFGNVVVLLALFCGDPLAAPAAGFAGLFFAVTLAPPTLPAPAFAVCCGVFDGLVFGWLTTAFFGGMVLKLIC
jgi:hypothetical protein